MTLILGALVLVAVAVVAAIGYLFYGLARAQREHREKNGGGMLK